VPQRFRQRASPRFRQGRQETGYLAPAIDSYVTPAAADALYSAPEEPAAAPAEVDNSYLAPVAAAAEVDNSYAAPAEYEEAAADNSYLAPAEYEYEEEYEEAAADNSYLAPAAAEDVPVYGEEELGGYNDLDSEASDAAGSESDPLKMLMNAVPGVPGEDYPIYAETPETAFSCDGQVDGGYYADEEAQCQVFHICTADGAGGLAKYSFLCPNGTIFNQNYFICDWWFNVDCAESAALAEAKNSEIAAARDAAAEASASDAADSYAAPADYESSYAAPEEEYEYEAAASDVAGGYLAPEEEYEEYEEQAAYGSAPTYQGRF